MNTCKNCYHLSKDRIDEEPCSLCVEGSEKENEYEYLRRRKKEKDLARLKELDEIMKKNIEGHPMTKNRSEKARQEWLDAFEEYMKLEKKVHPPKKRRNCSGGRMCYCAPFEEKEKQLKLYLISQTKNNNYDTYDSAVVAAESIEDAKTIHPSPYIKGRWWEDFDDYTSWVNYLNDIEVEYLGESKLEMKRGVVCSSYNAG